MFIQKENSANVVVDQNVENVFAKLKWNIASLRDFQIQLCFLLNHKHTSQMKLHKNIIKLYNCNKFSFHSYFLLVVGTKIICTSHNPPNLLMLFPSFQLPNLQCCLCARPKTYFLFKVITIIKNEFLFSSHPYNKRVRLS